MRGNPDNYPKHSVGDFEEETGFYQAVEVTDDSPVFSTKSEFQDIQVYKSKYYGKILMLDGVLQVNKANLASLSTVYYLPSNMHNLFSIFLVNRERRRLV